MRVGSRVHGWSGVGLWMMMAGADFTSMQAAAGVDQVHSTCASICAGLYACSKRDFNAMQKD